MEYEKLVDRFIKETDKKFDKLEERNDKKFDILHARHVKSDEKMDTLIAFRWQIIGGSAVAGLAVTCIFQIVFYLLTLPKPN